MDRVSYSTSVSLSRVFLSTRVSSCFVAYPLCMLIAFCLGAPMYLVISPLYNLWSFLQVRPQPKS